MKNKILSVVVPSYNAEKFLPIGIPTFLDDRVIKDIEILIVNDGSIDNTEQIAYDYEKKYPDAVKIINKENGGHGSTINSGISVATGKYFMVVDADDWVDKENFVKLIKILSKCNSDLVLTDAAIVNQDGKVTGHEWIKMKQPGIEFNIEEVFGQIKNIEMHNYCIKTELLQANNIRCHEHHFYVDNEFVTYSLKYVDTVTYFDMVLYQYLIGRVGQSVSIERRRKCLEQYTNVVDFLLEFYQHNCATMTPNKKDFFCRKIAYFTSGVYPILMSYNNREKKLWLKDYDAKLKKRAPEVYVANKNLCITIMRETGFGMYGVCSWIYRVVNGIRD